MNQQARRKLRVLLQEREEGDPFCLWGLTGAGEGNRTLLISLGSLGNATIRRPRRRSFYAFERRASITLLQAFP